MVVQILCYDSNHEDGPTFYNLSSLKFFGGILSEWYAWDGVRLLLYRVPKLQILSFEKAHLLGSNLRPKRLEEPLDICRHTLLPVIIKDLMRKRKRWNLLDKS